MALLPVLARPVATLEAGINAALTALMVFVPYVNLLQSAEAEGDLAIPEFPFLALLVSAAVIMLAQLPFLDGRRAPQVRRTEI